MRIEFNMAVNSKLCPLKCKQLEFESGIFTSDRRRFRQH